MRFYVSSTTNIKNLKIHERYYLLCMHCFVYTCLLISVHQVSVKLTLNAIIILRGCTIDRVMIKATHETSEDKVQYCTMYSYTEATELGGQWGNDRRYTFRALLGQVFFSVFLWILWFSSLSAINTHRTSDDLRATRLSVSIIYCHVQE